MSCDPWNFKIEWQRPTVFKNQFMGLLFAHYRFVFLGGLIFWEKAVSLFFRRYFRCAYQIFPWEEKQRQHINQFRQLKLVRIKMFYLHFLLSAFCQLTIDLWPCCCCTYCTQKRYAYWKQILLVNVSSPVTC